MEPMPLPASMITRDVSEVMATPWAKLSDRLDAATWEQLKLLASGIGDPHE